MDQNILVTPQNINNDDELGEHHQLNSLSYIKYLFKRRYQLIKMFNLIQIIFIFIIVAMIVIREFWKYYYIIVAISAILEVITTVMIFQMLIVSIWPIIFNLNKTSFKHYNVIANEIITTTKSNEHIKCNIILKKCILSTPTHSISIPIQLQDNTPQLTIPVENSLNDIENKNNIYFIISNIESNIKSNSLINTIINEYKKKMMINLHRYETYSNEISLNNSDSSFTYYIGNRSIFNIIISIVSVLFLFSSLHYRYIYDNIKFKNITYYKSIDIDTELLLQQMKSNEDISNIIGPIISNELQIITPQSNNDDITITTT